MADDAPSMVIAGNDAGSPNAKAYPVNAGSVYYDAGYAGGTSPYDFCMFTVSTGSASGTASIALPDPSVGDGIAVNVTTELVGYGETPDNLQNNLRYHGTDVLDMPVALDPNTQFTYSAAGATHVPGTCPGDSGGPTLFPAGADPSRQIVVGVHSFGGPGNVTCGQYTFGGDSRVLSRVGPGKFITAYLAGASMNGIGIRAGAGAAVPALPVADVGLLGLMLAAAASAVIAGRRPSRTSRL